MEDTLFNVFGISLVVIALALTAIGLRNEKFPSSSGMLVGIAVAIAGVVIATATFAWLNAEEEQEHKAPELAAERQAALKESVAEQQEAVAAEQGQAAAGGEAETPGGDGDTTSAAGAQVFDSQGCSGCHTLAAAGSSAETGPDLDQALAGKDAAYVEEAIVDPNAEIAQGFPPNVMPSNYGSDLTPEDLKALVDFLVESTSGKS